MWDKFQGLMKKVLQSEETGGDGVERNSTQKFEDLDGSVSDGAVTKPLSMTSHTHSETSLASIHPFPLKEPLLSNVSRESSRDVTASDSGRTGVLLLNDVGKAKNALQKLKEISEKPKKLLSLNKGNSLSSDVSCRMLSKEVPNAPSTTSTGVLPTATDSLTTAVKNPASAATKPKYPEKLFGNGLPQLERLTSIKSEAVKRAQELAAKIGVRQDPELAPLINMFPGKLPPEVVDQPRSATAPVLCSDTLGGGIDEHGNLLNMPKLSNFSSLKVNISRKIKEKFQNLKPEQDVDSGELQAKKLRAKQPELANVKAELDINPFPEVSSRTIPEEREKAPIPEVDWWDEPLLQRGSYSDIAEGSISEYRFKMEKITGNVEHPYPTEPPAETAPIPPQPLKLTEKEHKKLRIQRLLAAEKNSLEIIRQGLTEHPKPEVKMSNLMNLSKLMQTRIRSTEPKLEIGIRSTEPKQAHADTNFACKPNVDVNDQGNNLIGSWIRFLLRYLNAAGCLLRDIVKGKFGFIRSLSK